MVGWAASLPVARKVNGNCARLPGAVPILPGGRRPEAATRAVAIVRIGCLFVTMLAPPALSPEETARYSRHIMLPEIGMEGQQRISSARVLVIGAGGLGSPVALDLAAAGVGTIGLADFDRVELHNLQRQILHGTSDIGCAKVDSGTQRLSDVNPHVHVVQHRDGVRPENAVALFREYDLIVDGTDNFPTRYLNTDAAFFAQRPLVYGSIFKFEGQVTVFDPHAGGPCYRCLFPEPPPPGSVPNCGEAGVLGALCGVIGSLQAMEAIKRFVRSTCARPPPVPCAGRKRPSITSRRSAMRRVVRRMQRHPIKPPLLPQRRRRTPETHRSNWTSTKPRVCCGPAACICWMCAKRSSCAFARCPAPTTSRSRRFRTASMRSRATDRCSCCATSGRAACASRIICGRPASPT